MRSEFIVSSMFLLVLLAGLAPFVQAQCSACAQEGDWSLSAAAFLEGKPINETPAVWGPKAVRMTSSQFEKAEGMQENANDTSAAAMSSSETPLLDVDLENASAMPSSVSSGSPVMITAALKEQGSIPADNQTAPGETAAYNVTAIIKDPAGIEVGRTLLQPSSGDEYAGIWSGSTPIGTYNVTLMAERSGASRTFADALQIEVR